MAGLKLMDSINRWFNPWRRRILLMVGKALIKAVKDTDKLQVVQVSLMKDELKNDVERIQEFGFTSNPPEDSEAVIVCVGGDRSNMLVIATDYSAGRPKGLEPGESMQYNKDGQYMKINKNGKQEFKSLVYFTTLDTFLNKFLAHTHLGNSGVPTGPPSTGTPPTLPADFTTGS